jgi:hypothetical protein
MRALSGRQSAQRLKREMLFEDTSRKKERKPQHLGRPREVAITLT